MDISKIKKHRIIAYAVFGIVFFCVINICWWVGASAKNNYVTGTQYTNKVNGFSNFYYDNNGSSIAPNNSKLDVYGDGEYSVELNRGNAFFTIDDKVDKPICQAESPDNTSGRPYYLNDFVHKNWEKGRQEATLETFEFDSSYVYTHKGDEGEIYCPEGNCIYFYSDKDGTYNLDGINFGLDRDDNLNLYFNDHDEWSIDSINWFFYFKLIDKTTGEYLKMRFVEENTWIRSSWDYVPLHYSSYDAIEEMKNFVNERGFNTMYKGILDGRFKLELHSMILDTN